MLVGATLFAESYGFLKRKVLGWGVTIGDSPSDDEEEHGDRHRRLTLFVLALFVFIESVGL
jgi:hypothetical protein